MSVERKEVGPRMSQIVIHGDTVYLAGVVAHQNAGKSVTEQTREILATIERYLTEAGTDKAKLLSANIWLDRHGDLRRDERGVGCLGRARPYARTRHCRSQARRATVQGRDHGGCGALTCKGAAPAGLDDRAPNGQVRT